MKNILVVIALFLPLQGFSPKSLGATDIDMLFLYTRATVDRYQTESNVRARLQQFADRFSDILENSNLNFQVNIAHQQLIDNVGDTAIDGIESNGLTRKAYLSCREKYESYVTGSAKCAKPTAMHYHSSNEALSDLRAGWGPFSSVPRLRNNYKADVVVLFRDITDTGGLGYVSTDSDYAFSIVRIRNPYSTLTHEIGHNLGLSHSPRQCAEDGECRGKYDYSYGHGIDADFVTVMAYSSAFNGAEKTDIFSTPDISNCGESGREACGVDANNAEEVCTTQQFTNYAGGGKFKSTPWEQCRRGKYSDAVRSIKKTWDTVANHR